MRSDEDGFNGSWHTGIVIACGEKGLRHVRYDHLLSDDESEQLVEAVRVSPAIDGFVCGNRSSYRGKIRPSPPPAIEFTNWMIHYGMCVDAFYNDAWWEGVVFDTDDGSPERTVFFPDLGDEMKFGIQDLRITQDWNEVTENWILRGNWVLLELIEEFEGGGHIPVSVKQIWYDLRGEKDFTDKVKEWTCKVKKSWKKMVFDVIDQYLRFSAEVLSKRLAELKDELVDSDALLPVSETAYGDWELVRPGLDVDIGPGAETIHPTALVPFDDSLSSERVIDNGASAKNVGEFSGMIADGSLQGCGATISPSAALLEPGMDQLASMVNRDALTVNLLTDSNTSHHKEALCVIPHGFTLLPSDREGSSTTSSVSHGVKDILSNGSDKIDGKSVRPVCTNTGRWWPISSEMLNGAEFCPTAIDEYCAIIRSGTRWKSRCRDSIKTDVWKHLLHLGWKIDSSCENGIPRKRYTSRDGRCFYSLSQVCKLLKESAGDLLSSASEDDLRRMDSLSVMSLPLEQLQQSQSTEGAKLDFCSHPVMEYCQLRNERSKVAGDMRIEARKQLFAAGWEAEVRTHEITGRKTVLYKSPTGKVYQSVLAACKGFLKEESNRNTITSCRRAKCINFAGQSQGLSTGNMLSFAENGFNFHENLVQPNAVSKKLSVESSSVSKSNFVDLDKVKVHGVRRNPKRISAKCLKKDGKPSHPKDRNSTLLKVKRSTKSHAFINSRYDKDHTRRKCVLRSSKRVQEVVIPNSTHHNPRSILSWLIDNNKVLPRAKVYYLSRKEKCSLAEGRITRDGIKCSCCGKVFGISSFEVHAGSSCRKPSANIVLIDGKSLLDCQKEILNDRKRQSSTIESCGGVKSNWRRGENDYVCSVCHYGGELLLCDQCPSSFHKSCLGLEVDSLFASLFLTFQIHSFLSFILKVFLLIFLGYVVRVELRLFCF